MNINGTSGNDNLSGSTGDDTFIMSQGGNDVVSGLGGNDRFKFGAKLDVGDHVDGGTGKDVLILDGDYSSLHLFGPATIHSIEQLNVSAGHSYNLEISDGNIAAGETLTVSGAALGAGDTLTFFGQFETDGNLIIHGGAGNDHLYGGGVKATLTGGDGNDVLNGYSSGSQTLDGGNGNDIAFVQSTGKVWFTGGAGDDSINFNENLSANDRIDGGDGYDQVSLSGDYSAGVTFKATSFTSVESIYLNNGADYKLKMNDGNVAAGQHLNVTAGLFLSNFKFTFDASQETDGSYGISGGVGDDVLIGGQAGNTFIGDLGHDLMTAGAGADVFGYYGVTDSRGTSRDVITGFDADHDSFQFFSAVVTGVDAAIAAGTMREGHFEDDLVASVNAAHLAAGHAVLFTASAGNLSGHTFLVVDANGVAGYQAGQDYVMQLDAAAHLNHFALGNFI